MQIEDIELDETTKTGNEGFFSRSILHADLDLGGDKKRLCDCVSKKRS